jgi:hypothetical protein
LSLMAAMLVASPSVISTSVLIISMGSGFSPSLAAAVATGALAAPAVWFLLPGLAKRQTLATFRMVSAVGVRVRVRVRVMARVRVRVRRVRVGVRARC